MNLLRVAQGPAADTRSIALRVFLCLIPVGIILVSITKGSDAHFVKYAMPSILWATENPVAGYNMIWHGDFMFLENIYFFTQSEALQGIKYHHTAGFTDRRIFYAFLALPFRPFLGDYGMFQTVNVLLFAANGALLYLFSARLFQDKLSALLALVLFIFSMPVSATVGSYSAHIAAMFFTYLWAYLMLREVVDRTQIDAIRVLGLSCVLGLWSLSYGSTMAGLAIFVVLLIWRRKFLLIPVPILISFSAGKAQLWVMQLAGFGAGNDMVQSILSQSLSYHINSLLGVYSGYFQTILRFSFDVLFVDNPVVSVLAIGGLIFFKIRAKPLLWLVLILLTAALFVYQPIGALRGYAIPGVSIITLTVVGHMLAKSFGMIRITRLGYGLAALALCVIASQAAWSNAARVGIQLPSVSYFSGPVNTCSPLTLTPTRYLNATGDPDDVPHLFGGRAPLDSFILEDKKKTRYIHKTEILTTRDWLNSWVSTKPKALLVQSVIWILIFGILWCFVPSKRNPKSFIGLALVLLGLVFLPMRHRVLDFSDRIDIWSGALLKEGDRVEGEMVVSPAFIKRLSAFETETPVLQVYIQHSGRGGNCLTFKALGLSARPDLPWSWGDPHAGTFITMPITEAVRRLKADNFRVRFAIAYDRQGCDNQIAILGAWQSTQLGRGRRARIVRSNGETIELPRFPSLELRVIRENKYLPSGHGPFAEVRRKLKCVTAIGF